MTQRLKEKNEVGTNMVAIREILAKRALLVNCRRKMEMAELNSEDSRIYEAACKQLIKDINSLCWRIGL